MDVRHTPLARNRRAALAWGLFLCLSALPALAVNLTVDATGVSSRVIIDGNTIQEGTVGVIDLAPNTPFSVQLAPGAIFSSIEVSSVGVVSYDPSFEGNPFTGAGTATLTLVGHPVTIDATALSGTAIVTGLENFSPAKSFTYSLVPGDYRIQGLPGGVHSFVFSVDGAGDVAYDPGLDGVVYAGQGTDTLSVLGFAITFDGSQLDNLGVFETELNGLGINDPIVAYSLPVGAFRIQANPGYLLDLADPRTGVQVGVDGTVSYDPAIDGLGLAGLGTDTVAILPHPVLVDATSAGSDVLVSFEWSVFDGATRDLDLSVGTYTVTTTVDGNLGNFILTADGSCTPDEFPTASGVVSVLCGAVCLDGDGDGFGNPGGAACSGGPATDCDDADGGVYPGAVELPGNAVDENCDGSLGACDPTAAWKNHGQYVRCVAHEVNDLVDQGLITQDQADDLITAAAQSDVGKK